MKQTLRFMGKFCWQFLAVFAVFAVVIAAGMWANRWQESGTLFDTYYSIFNLFVVIMPSIFTMSMRYYHELCISFGALRRDSFWALQLLGVVIVVGMLVLGVLLELFVAQLPMDRIYVFWSLLSPKQAVLVALASLAMLQGGLCLGRVKQNKVLAWIMGAIFGLTGASIGLGIGFVGTYEGDMLGMLQAWYLPMCLVLLAVMAGLFCLALRLYRKAVVTL